MSRGNAKVSLIVPVYNVEKYLERCMDSCARQTLVDLEILCVNDGSTDGSRGILEWYAGRDSRIQILDRENGGVSAARNAGMNAARGEWIMFLDADDYLEPDACERVWAESLEERPDIITFGGAIFPEVPERAQDAWLRRTLSPRRVRHGLFRARFFLDEPGMEPFVWQHAFSAAFLDHFGLRFEEALRAGEDITFLFAAFPLAERTSFLPDKLYHYRIARSDSLTEQMHETGTANVEWRFGTIERILSIWERYGIAQTYRFELGEWFMRLVQKAIADLDDGERAGCVRRLFDLLKEHSVRDCMRELSTAQRRQLRWFLRS